MMYGGGYGPGMMGGGYGLVWLGMAFFGFLFLVGLALLALWAIRAGHGGMMGGATGRGHMKASDAAYDVARERYARGEITAEEFDDIKQRLGY